MKKLCSSAKTPFWTVYRVTASRKITFTANKWLLSLSTLCCSVVVLHWCHVRVGLRSTSFCNPMQSPHQHFFHRSFWENEAFECILSIFRDKLGTNKVKHHFVLIQKTTAPAMKVPQRLSYKVAFYLESLLFKDICTVPLCDAVITEMYELTADNLTWTCSFFWAVYLINSDVTLFFVWPTHNLLRKAGFLVSSIVTMSVGFWIKFSYFWDLEVSD